MKLLSSQISPFSCFEACQKNFFTQSSPSIANVHSRVCVETLGSFVRVTEYQNETWSADFALLKRETVIFTGFSNNNTQK